MFCAYNSHLTSVISLDFSQPRKEASTSCTTFCTLQIRSLKSQDYQLKEWIEVERKGLRERKGYCLCRGGPQELTELFHSRHPTEPLQELWELQPVLGGQMSMAKGPRLCSRSGVLAPPTFVLRLWKQMGSLCASVSSSVNEDSI